MRRATVVLVALLSIAVVGCGDTSSEPRASATTGDSPVAEVVPATVTSPAAGSGAASEPLLLGYVVLEGDTVTSVAAARGIDPRYVAWHNAGVEVDTTLEAGTVLEVPRFNGIVHRLERGETLSAIALRYGVTVDAITSHPANGLSSGPPAPRTDGTLLVPGATMPAANRVETVFLPLDAGEPVAFGPFSLVPWGYVGDLPLEQLPVPSGFTTGDLEKLKEAALYREIPPALVPDRLEIVQGSTWDGNSENAVYLAYRKVSATRPVATTETWIMRHAVRPIYVDLKRSDQGDIATSIVDGAHTIVIRSFGPPQQDRHMPRRDIFSVQVFMALAEVDVYVSSSDYPAEVLVPVARSLLGR